MPDDFVKAAEVGELASGERKLVDMGGQPVLLFNLGGSYYAVDEECSHAFGRLSMGEAEVTRWGVRSTPPYSTSRLARRSPSLQPSLSLSIQSGWRTVTC